MQAECRALLDGLKLILQHSLEEYQIVIESDSQVLVQMVLGRAEVPWRCKGHFRIDLKYFSKDGCSNQSCV